MIKVLLELGEKSYKGNKVRMAYCDWKSGERFSTLDNVGTECGIIFQVIHEFKGISDERFNDLSTKRPTENYEVCRMTRVLEWRNGTKSLISDQIKRDFCFLLKRLKSVLKSLRIHEGFKQGNNMI